jgi:DNA-binding transcriptional regulator PaaX
MAAYLGVSVRTVATAIERLTKGGLLIEAERHGRLIYYRATPEGISRIATEI